MFIKLKKITLLSLLFMFCIILISCEIPDAFNFQEGIYKNEDVEVILYEDITITGISIELKEIEKAESENNTLKNYVDKKEYEVKLIFIINNEEVQCDFIKLPRSSNQPDAYDIEANVSAILNIENTLLHIVLGPTRIDDPYGKDSRATRFKFRFKYLYEDEKVIDKKLYNIELTLDYVFDENKKIEV